MLSSSSPDAADSPARSAWRRAQRALEIGNNADARRWLERAHRLIPDDVLITLALGSLRLTCGDAAGAARLLAPHAATAPGAPAYAAAKLVEGDEPAAAAALTIALQQSIVTDELAALAERINPAWCGLDSDARLRIGSADPVVVLLDGAPITPGDRLNGETLVVDGTAGPFLGSPLSLRRLNAVQGVVAEQGGELVGWAWVPADTGRAAALTASGPGGAGGIKWRGPAEGVEGLPPLARPRRFVLSRAECEALGNPVAITDWAGTHLLGSPVWRGRKPDIAPKAAPRIDLRPRGADIVVPIYRGLAETLACLDAVLATVPATCVVHVVDDASPEPALVEAVQALAAAARIRLHRHEENRGFPSAANTGLRAAAGRDVVLLNSDTIVSPGWLERLRAAAYRAPDTGTATPLSDDGSIVSYRGTGSPAAMDALAQAVNAGRTAALPVGVGFCLYLRRDCLDQVGLFREDLFAQGYGEETEFCLRARRSGWRHVAALDVFVAHRGGVSFGSGRVALQRRNQAIIERQHRGYKAEIAAFQATDPLFEARRRMDALLWGQQRLASAVLLVSHGEGGGVAEMVAGRAASLRRAGVRPVVIVPAVGGCRVEGFGDLRFAVPSELPALADLLREDRPLRLELHHLLGHDHAVLGLAALLGIPVETWVHDAASFCPRVALIGRERRFCGEPGLETCEACVAELGSNLREPIGPTALVARSAADLMGSHRVVVPTADMARRMRRHFPALRPVVVPWEDDGALPPTGPAPDAASARICVVGAIGVEKGYDVLLACAADARERALPLEFVVCGYTEDDERLMATGPVFVTGRYDAAEAVGLIRAQRAQLAFIPSIWPETWCFALSRAWQAGLSAVAFDLGAPGERIRARGSGHLLPLGLPAFRVNDALLRLARVRAGLQPSRVMQPDRSRCPTKPAPVP